MVGIRALRLGFESWGWDMSHEAGIWAMRLGFEPWGWDLSLGLGFEPKGWDLGLKSQDWHLGLKTGIWASKLGFEPQGWDLSLKPRIWALRLGFEPWGWDLCLEAGIGASRLGLEPWGWDLSLEAGIWALRGDGGEGEGKNPPMWESIGHWPLRGRCQKRGTRSFALLHSLTCLLRNAALAPITLLLLPGIILKCSTAKTLFCCYVFVTMSVNPSISPSVHPSVCTAVCQSNGRFVIPFVCLFIGPSVHQFIRLAFLFLVLDKNRYFGRH